MTDIYENNSEINAPILPVDPCIECGEGFTAKDWSEVCSYGLRGDAHRQCCREHDCDLNDLECE